MVAEPVVRPRPVERWWEEGATRHRLAGVFEGGGAKGLAYVGALQGVFASGAWFSAVAGTSAGAITAALIAAGTHPDDLEELTREGLALLGDQLPRGGTLGRARSARPGLRQLRSTGAFFDQAGLDGWLEAVLRAAVVEPGEEGDRVSFADLFAATGIELNVVAADVSVGRQVVFNARWTPLVSVTRAVLASAAIPGAFLRGDLRVPLSGDGEGPYVIHTIVDGGVWSNFPMFVFEDAAYQQWQDAAVDTHPRSDEPKSARPAYDRVVGFMLDEADASTLAAPVYERATFAPPGMQPDRELPAREWVGATSSSEAPERSWLGRLGALLLDVLFWPIRLARWISQYNAGVPRGRWPTPRNRLARAAVDVVDGVMVAFHPPLLRLIGMLLVFIGAWQGVKTASELFFGDLIESGFTSVPAWSGAVVGVAVLAGIVLLALAVLAFLATNAFATVAVRTLAFGVARTYFAGPGAPPWAKRWPNVIALPIPPGLNTLTFSADEATQRSAVEGARAAVLAELPAILASASAPPAEPPPTVAPA
jgi:predicted acylesterase/phospholipase RssA